MAETPDQTEPRVPIVCSACGTETRIPLAELPESLEQHNERQHDGADIAEVEPELADELADLAPES